MAYSRRTFLSVTGAAAASAQTPEVVPVVPEDGGTPRDPARIVRRGPAEFNITASVEEPSGSPLTHAVSRVDVIVRNPGPEREVVLHIDVSGDGKRPNFNDSHFGGMPERDYVYVLRPGEIWRRVVGRTDRWVITVRFRVPAGETKVGLSPWYTYGDYLGFVNGLAPHPHLRKEMVGKSDQGREHWELTITDPSVARDKKRTVLWHAREHAYETLSSLAAEGLVAYLLSPEAAEYRKRFVFSIHPMVNIDGVGSGYEYRGGYDFPSPRNTASGRITFERLDALRPDFVVAWHNWISPRSVDVVFFTDGEQGRSVRRAWDLFTQRFPSPRSVGHQWDSQRNPNEKNWFSRKNLNPNNIHQYALKQGAKVWGWEMPWWNRDEGDPLAYARQMGANFGRAFLGTIEEINKPASAPAEAPVVQATSREMYEFVLRGKSNVPNPFRDAALVGEFTAPSGKIISLEGFYCGGDQWKLRFAPEEEGQYRYLLRGEGLSLFQQGRMQVAAPKSHGFIGIHPKNPYVFAYSDGTAFFPMGDTCYGLHDDTPVTPELRREYLDTRRRQNFNFVRMSIGHSPARAAADPRYWAWGGTAAEPDYDQINPRFFDSLDEVLGEMATRGMNVELLLFNYYRKPFTDPKVWTPTRERTWLRYVIARYAAYRHIFLWTLSNEYETHPDGKYLLDRTDDPEWAKMTARIVRSLDPYMHPVSVHPVVSSSARGGSPRDDFDAPWRIGGLFGEGTAIEVLSQQTSSAWQYRSQWNDALGCWVGDPEGIEQSIAADRIYRKPVMNTENGYEYLAGYPTDRKQVYHTDHVRRAAWRIVCAGGYFAAGFASTLAHGDVWDRIDPGSRHPFLVKDSGAASQLAALYGFFTALPFWRMQPRPFSGTGLCLAASDVLVVYLPHGGTCVPLWEESGGEFTQQWFNPRAGSFAGQATPLSSNQEVKTPDREDWALLIKRTR